MILPGDKGCLYYELVDAGKTLVCKGIFFDFAFPTKWYLYFMFTVAILILGIALYDHAHKDRWKK